MNPTYRSIERQFTLPVAVLDYANPNRHGLVALVAIDIRAHSQFDNDEFCVIVEDPDAWEPEYWDFSTYEQAAKFYDDFVTRQSSTPNWEAQAEYDEAHGTINGEDPGVVAMREMLGEY